MSEPSAKPICFYLPQFHRIEENDAWWEPGFTEWTMVDRARPIFAGHRQPVAPLPPHGRYNLLDRAVRAWQGDLARAHGVYGFCYYHYWFHGKRLLEQPLERMLVDGAPDLPFMLAWANEPWTRRWDGRDNDVLQAQEYGDEADWDQHFETLLRFFRDARYIQVDGAPVFLIYRAGHIPCLSAMLNRWRALSRKAGFDGLHVVSILSGFRDHEAVLPHVDAVCEFPPRTTADLMYGCHLDGLRVTTAEQAWRHALAAPRVHAVQYPGAFAGWDNSPRVATAGLVYLPLRPERFQTLLTGQMRRAVHDAALPEPFVFINAWNEWGEGCYLEPDDHCGDALLAAVKNAVAAAPHCRAPAPVQRVVVRVSEATDDVRVTGALVLRCHRLHPNLVSLCRAAHLLVLETIEPELLDRLQERHAAGLPSVLKTDAILNDSLKPEVARVRGDLLGHALPLASGILGSAPWPGAADLPHFETFDSLGPRLADGAPVDLSPYLADCPSADVWMAQGLLPLDLGPHGTAYRQALGAASAAEALQVLLPLSDRHPDYLLVHQQVARILNDVHQPEDALQTLSKAGPPPDRDDPATLCELGRACFQRKAVTQARQLLTAALTRAPWHLRGWAYLLRLLATTNDAERLTWTHRACDAHPRNYALALLPLDSLAPQDAVAVVSHVVDGLQTWGVRDDEEVSVTSQIVKTCLGLDLRGPQGLQLLARATRVCSRSARLADVYGQMLRAAGRHEEARAEHMRAAALRRIALTWKAEMPASAP